jgi:hypothetical protein
MKPDYLEKFQLGVDYRETHPTKEGKRRWRYILLRSVKLHCRGLSDLAIEYKDKHGKVWARHDQSGLYVEAGYSWKGCSPKRWVWPFGWVGTPDFECTIFASLCHDVHYQFALTEHFPLHKSGVDMMFYHTIEMSGDKNIATLYFDAVRRFGRWSDRPENGEFSVLTPHD